MSLETMDEPCHAPPGLPQPCRPGIGDHAVIGDCRSLALVSRQGVIGWLCVPHFSGPSCFASLLDEQVGGRFAIDAHDVRETRQCYVEGTNIVETELVCTHGTLKVTDFMTLPSGSAQDRTRDHQQCIVRLLECTEGSVRFDVDCAIRPAYGELTPSLSPQTGGQEGEAGWCLSWPQGHAVLTSDLPFAAGDGALRAREVRWHAGQKGAVLLAFGDTRCAPRTPLSAADGLYRSTLQLWRRWSDCCQYQGPYRDDVLRSALTMKLLTYAPSGAIMAAGTTSLPESLTAARNWDYRYCWLRDTSMVLQAFMDIGYLHESDAFLRWLLQAGRSTTPTLRVLYDEEGKDCPRERNLPHLRGHCGVGPVRVGNDACDQLQLDIYGEVIATAADFVERGGQLDDAEQGLLRELTGTVCRLWREPDAGIWEVRTPPRHNTHSKLMCWVALDRVLWLNDTIGLGLDAQRVAAERDAIRADIDAHGWSQQTGGYVGAYGTDVPDASLLLMPRFGYVDACDTRMQATVDHIRRDLTHKGLLYRYPAGVGYDGVQGTENLFVICSFWLVDCLARQGRLGEAHGLFERLLALRNHVGLYAEEFDAQSLRPLGNFPQAFSHVGLITAALSLHRHGKGRATPPR